MEIKPKCMICSKVFSNGRALGGHMRAHLATLPLPIPILPPPPPPKTEPPTSSSLSNSTSSSSPSQQNLELDDGKGLTYGLRENPKRNFIDSGFIVQDQESETDEAEEVVVVVAATESTRKPTRKRSKRRKKLVLALGAAAAAAEVKKLPRSYGGESMMTTELEPPVSSVSCASPDEDVAMCLMMLSRDVWRRSSGGGYSVDSAELKPSQTMTRGGTRKGKKYQCETCNKVFKSFQALGGHRTSHNKKIKNCSSLFQENMEEEDVGVKLHECPFCYKLFRSGQALGGHKRSHLLSSSTTTKTKTPPKLGGGGGGGGGSLVNTSKFVDNMVIDLNLPAPMEEEEEEELLEEVSAVSDAELTPTSCYN